MTDPAQDLRHTSDALLRDLEVLIALEEEKRAMEPGDDRLVELAQRIEAIAGRVTAETTKQVRLVTESDASVAAGDEPPPSIDDTPPRTTSAILAEWRAAQRTLDEAPEGSAEALEASARIDALRDEYRRAYDALRRG